MNQTKSVTKKCPYCMEDVEVVNFSYRTIKGYVNPVNMKNVAFIEHLGCGHEFVDGKFNIDKLYFTEPIRDTQSRQVMPIKQTRYENRIVYKKSGFNHWDAFMMICLVVNLCTAPVFAVLPVLYFIGRFMDGLNN